MKPNLQRQASYDENEQRKYTEKSRLFPGWNRRANPMKPITELAEKVKWISFDPFCFSLMIKTA